MKNPSYHFLKVCETVLIKNFIKSAALDLGHNPHMQLKPLAHLMYCFGLDQEYGCCGTSRKPPQ